MGRPVIVNLLAGSDGGSLDSKHSGTTNLCNLYSITKGQQAIRQFTGAMRDRTGTCRRFRASIRTTRRRSSEISRTAEN